MCTQLWNQEWDVSVYERPCHMVCTFLWLGVWAFLQRHIGTLSTGGIELRAGIRHCALCDLCARLPSWAQQFCWSRSCQCTLFVTNLPEVSLKQRDHCEEEVQSISDGCMPINLSHTHKSRACLTPLITQLTLGSINTANITRSFEIPDTFCKTHVIRIYIRNMILLEI